MNAIPNLDFQPDVEVTKIITCTVVGVVEAEDVQRLATAGLSAQPPKGTTEGELKRVKERHHSVARLIASGLTQTQVAAITGYTNSHLSILLNAPAMQELVIFYRAQHNGAAEVIAERLRTVSLTAVDKLADKMDADELEAGELLGLAKLGLDRSGHGPSSKHQIETTQHIVDHAELMRMNRAARAESREDIIDLKALPAPHEATTPAAKDGGE